MKSFGNRPHAHAGTTGIPNYPGRGVTIKGSNIFNQIKLEQLTKLKTMVKKWMEGRLEYTCLMG
jgi:hypothetical protein